MIAENKRTGKVVEFTLEQWRNLENTGHAIGWKVIDAGIVQKTDQIDFVKPFGKEPTALTIEYHLNYRKLLDEAGIKYDKRIKNQLRLKEIYEQNKKV